MRKKQVMEENDDEHDENKDDESSPVIKIIQSSIRKLKINVQKNIKYICKSYSLNVMEIPFVNNDSNYVDVDAFIKSKVIKTDDEMRKRENKLISFCEWIYRLNEELSGSNLIELMTFNDLQKWLNDIHEQFILLVNECMQYGTYIMQQIINRETS